MLVSRVWLKVIESFSAVVFSFGEVSRETSLLVDLQFAFKTS